MTLGVGRGVGKLHLLARQRLRRHLEVLSPSFAALPANDTTAAIRWRIEKDLRTADLGYAVNELGEYRSTIRKLTEHEIIDRLTSKAHWDICQAEDARVFAELDICAAV